MKQCKNTNDLSQKKKESHNCTRSHFVIRTFLLLISIGIHEDLASSNPQMFCSNHFVLPNSVSIRSSSRVSYVTLILPLKALNWVLLIYGFTKSASCALPRNCQSVTITSNARFPNIRKPPHYFRHDTDLKLLLGFVFQFINTKFPYATLAMTAISIYCIAPCTSGSIAVPNSRRTCIHATYVRQSSGDKKKAHGR